MGEVQLKCYRSESSSLGHDKSVVGQDPSLPGVNLCFHLQTMEGGG